MVSRVLRHTGCLREQHQAPQQVLDALLVESALQKPADGVERYEIGGGQRKFGAAVPFAIQYNLTLDL